MRTGDDDRGRAGGRGGGDLGASAGAGADLVAPSRRRPAAQRQPAVSWRCTLSVLAALPGIVLAALAGCIAAPVRAPVLLTLPAAASALPAGAAPMAPPPRLAVRRVGLPEYLLARRVRYRADASTLAEWPDTYWAERLEVAVTREFASALRARLPGWEVCEGGCADAAPVLVVQAELAPLDYLRGAGRLQARARLVLSQGGAAPRLLHVREYAYDIEARGDTPQAQAQAIAEAVRRLAAAGAALAADAAAAVRR